MRVLLDTNVLISAILFGGRPRTILLAATRGRFELISSLALMAEIEGLLVRKFAFSQKAAAGVRSELEQLAEMAAPDRVPRVARDRDDEEVLAAAVVGQVEVIVTGDRDLLVLETHEGIAILTPKDFPLPEG